MSLFATSGNPTSNQDTFPGIQKSPMPWELVSVEWFLAPLLEIARVSIQKVSGGVRTSRQKCAGPRVYGKKQVMYYVKQKGKGGDWLQAGDRKKRMQVENIHLVT